MAALEEFETEVGDWLLIENGADKLRALIHRGDDDPEPGFTLFWPGRFDAVEMMNFYKSSEGKVAESRSAYQQARVVTYERDSGEDKMTFGAALPDYGGGWPDEPTFQNADFVRFEHVAIGQDGSERPILVLWCVVDDSLTIPVGTDSAGLLMQPRHLPGLRPAIATLVTRTSADRPSLGNVVEMLEQLEEHLSPDASPIAVAA
jgi:hypothetical protein